MTTLHRSLDRALDNLVQLRLTRGRGLTPDVSRVA